MSNDPIKIIVRAYLDGAGFEQREDHSTLYWLPVQIDEFQLSKLAYLSNVLAAPRNEFSQRMFQAALDLALDEYRRFSEKSEAQAYAEMDQVLKGLRRKGYFEELRKRGYLKGEERQPPDEG
jgi:hypothetical protein